MYGKKVDKSDILQSGGSNNGAKFGVNPFVLENISLETDDKSSNLYISIEGSVGDRQFRHREYEVTRAYDSAGNEVTDSNDPAFQKAVDMFNSYMNDFGCAYVGEEKYYSALTSQQFNGFSDFANFVINIIKASDTFKNNKPILIFLQFQWEPRSGQERTYLEFPKSKSIKHGDFFAFCPSNYNTNFRKFVTKPNGKIVTTRKVNNDYIDVEVGEWTETEDPKTVTATITVDDKNYAITYTSSTSKVSYENGRIGLFFLNEDGQMPPLTRTAWFASSQFANVTELKDQKDDISAVLESTDDDDLPFME